MIAIKSIEVSKSFNHYAVIKNVSFEIGQGECYALLGPNGAGKTTLLRMLSTLCRPTSGAFSIMGFDGVSERAGAREHLFFVGHGSHLYDDLSIEENIQFSMGIRGINPGIQPIKAAIDRAGVGAFSKLKCRYLSAGMKKRVAVAKVLLVKPKVLILDEVYASLDEKGISMVNGCIKDFLKSGVTILMTTHDRFRAHDVASRAGVLFRGVLREITISDLVGVDALF